MNRISLCLFMDIKFVYFVLCHLGWGRVWTWVYDPPMTFTIISGRWVGNTGCPAKLSTKGGHPSQTVDNTNKADMWGECCNNGITFKVTVLDIGIKVESIGHQQWKVNPLHWKKPKIEFYSVHVWRSFYSCQIIRSSVQQYFNLAQTKVMPWRTKYSTGWISSCLTTKQRPCRQLAGPQSARSLQGYQSVKVALAWQ
jgi:hypothetical protein